MYFSFRFIIECDKLELLRFSCMFQSNRLDGVCIFLMYAWLHKVLRLILNPWNIADSTITIGTESCNAPYSCNNNTGEAWSTFHHLTSEIQCNPSNSPVGPFLQAHCRLGITLVKELAAVTIVRVCLNSLTNWWKSTSLKNLTLHLPRIVYREPDYLW